MAFPVCIGVLALQGSYREHMTCLTKVGVQDVVEIRKPSQLEGVDGLIIPGGESTTMALIAQRWGMIDSLKEFAASGKPIWGTCAGLIFLAEEGEGMKEGGQVLLGGLHVRVHRNFFGSQIDSFECTLPAAAALGSDDGQPPQFRAIFIRAPAITSVKPSVEVLAEWVVPEAERAASGYDKVVVAVREKTLLATAFHPELTEDLRWHKLFANMVDDHSGGARSKADKTRAADLCTIAVPTRPLDLPVFSQTHFSAPV
uniref:glutaminase n=1 Tax=Pyramimonas obovata TaxID=1411642 RepID=A0A7S0RIR3_9CHLO|mmetsp:Transcript_34592/g.75612  ORF Transcript_34592/g.75612 Transcript_34592/m.75612 type:complete len:257 (+) Transcript_34592:100-870(+)|eukprot:CAMPEP_0118925688 /NCGR_PEP_ID=MMETSP1169-20130426/3535_1 /TAXON_ID=36882 /ORGANISM="Pyramimonas obovata, Strain CCMP722" /LENGTH=256 /DNA_ID=CAMNT_0006867059 /DNA_START=60 /DNA_END=830 /DNA_ORIENTATION=+